MVAESVNGQADAAHPDVRGCLCISIRRWDENVMEPSAGEDVSMNPSLFMKT